MANTKVTRSLQEASHGRLLATTEKSWVRDDVKLGALLRIAEATERIAAQLERFDDAIKKLNATMTRTARSINAIQTRLRRLERAGQRGR